MTRAQLEQKMERHRRRRESLEAELEELRSDRLALIRAGREAGISVERMGRLLGHSPRRISYALAAETPTP